MPSWRECRPSLAGRTRSGMEDPRIHRLADLVTGYCLGLRPGEVVRFENALQAFGRRISQLRETVQGESMQLRGEAMKALRYE